MTQTPHRQKGETTGQPNESPSLGDPPDPIPRAASLSWSVVPAALPGQSLASSPPELRAEDCCLAGNWSGKLKGRRWGLRGGEPQVPQEVELLIKWLLSKA